MHILSIMEYRAIKTRILQPPKDDMYSVFDEYLTDVHENDIVLVTSKIVPSTKADVLKKRE